MVIFLESIRGGEPSLEKEGIRNSKVEYNPLTLLKKIIDNQFSTDALLSNVAHPERLKQPGGDIVVSAAFLQAVYDYLHLESPSQENKKLLDLIITSLSSCTFEWPWEEEPPDSRERHGCRVPLVQATMIVSAYWLLEENWMKRLRSDRKSFLNYNRKKALMNILKFYANGRPKEEISSKQKITEDLSFLGFEKPEETANNWLKISGRRYEGNERLELPQPTLPTLFAQILAYAALHMIKTGFGEWNEPPPHPTNDFISWNQDNQLNPALLEEVNALKKTQQLYNRYKYMINDLRVPILPKILNCIAS